MNHKSATQLATMDIAIYQSRGSIEAARAAAIRQIWRDLRASISRSRAAPINSPAAAAA